VEYSQFIKSLMPAYEELRSTCNELGLPERLFQNTIKLYKQLMLKQLTQGRSRKELVNACLLVVSELLNYPLLLKEVIKASGVEKKRLLRCKSFIKQNVDLPRKQVDTSFYITRLCYELGLAESEASKAIKKIKEVEKKLVNKTNKTKALVCIYLACSDQGVSIRDLARVSGMSISHVWKSVKECQDE